MWVLRPGPRVFGGCLLGGASAWERCLNRSSFFLRTGRPFGLWCAASSSILLVGVAAVLAPLAAAPWRFFSVSGGWSLCWRGALC